MIFASDNSVSPLVSIVVGIGHDIDSRTDGAGDFSLAQLAPGMRLTHGHLCLLNSGLGMKCHLVRILWLYGLFIHSCIIGTDSNIFFRSLSLL